MTAYEIQAANYNDDISHLLDLYIKLADREMAYGLYDPKFSSFIALKSFPLSTPDDLRDIVNHEFTKTYRSSRIIIENNQSALFPENLFDRNKAKDIFSFTTPFNATEETLYIDHLKTSGMLNVFKISNLLKEIITPYFPQAKITHYATALLSGLMVNSNDETEFTAHVNPDFFHIAITKNNKLIFCNSFEYETIEDILYYILASYEHFELSPKTQPLKLYGAINRFDELKDLLNTYIMFTELGERPANFAFDKAFDQLPEHLYFPLLSLPLCEL